MSQKAATAGASLQRCISRHDFSVAEIVGLVEQRVERSALRGVVDARLAGSGARRHLSGRGTSDVGERGGGQGQPFRIWLRAPSDPRAWPVRAERIRWALLCPFRRVVGPKRKAFRRRIVDAGDDKAQFLDRLNARIGKGSERRILGVPVRPDFAEPGDDRGRRPCPWEGAASEPNCVDATETEAPSPAVGASPSPTALLFVGQTLAPVGGGASFP